MLKKEFLSLNSPENKDKLLELDIKRIFANVQLGNIFEDISFGVQDTNILEYVTSSEYEPSHVFETVSKCVNNALKVHIYHNSKEKIPIRLSAETNAEFYINLKIELIKVWNIFSAYNEKIDISYYAEMAKIKFLQYINRGIDYVETIDSKSVENLNADVRVTLSSPVIFLKDPRPNIDRWIILNLGTVVMSTKFEERQQIVNGQEIN